MEELGFALGSYLGGKALDYGKNKLFGGKKGGGGKPRKPTANEINNMVQGIKHAGMAKGRHKFRANANSNHQNGFSNKITAPVSEMRRYRQMGPGIHYHPGGEITISHTERFGAVTASVLFNVQRFECNPGIPVMANWLTNIAKQYEYYTIEKWECQYKPKCSTDIDGDVTIMVDYDAGGETPLSSVEMENFVGQVNTMPWKEVTHHSSKQNLKMIPNRLVRSNDLSSETTDDRRLTDWGVLYVANEGQAAAIAGNTLGYLYSTYTIKLHTPKGVNGPSFIYGYFLSTGVSETDALPLGAAPTTATTTNGMSIVGVTNNRLTFQRPGAYIVNIESTGVAISDVNCITTDTFSTGVAEQYMVCNAAGTTGAGKFWVDVIHPGGWVGFTLTCTSVSSTELEVSEINSVELPQALLQLRKQKKLRSTPNYLEPPQKVKFEIRESKGDDTDTESVSDYKVVQVPVPPLVRQKKSL